MKDGLINELTSALDDACDKIEENMKKPLLDSISPRTSIGWQELAAKTPAELMIMKDVLDSSVQQTFKSGTPISDSKKPTQSALLDSTFDRAQADRILRSKRLKEGK